MSYRAIDASQISVSSTYDHLETTNVEDALQELMRNIQPIEWRRNENGHVQGWSGNELVADMDWKDSVAISNATGIITTTSSDITFNTGNGETTTIKELKDEIQFLKDEINNLKMLLLEN